MDGAKVYGQCVICGQTISAHINVAKPPGHKFMNSVDAELLAACKAARSVLDKLMGDSDLEGDDSDEFIAMQMLSSAIEKAEGLAP